MEKDVSNAPSSGPSPGPSSGIAPGRSAGPEALPVGFLARYPWVTFVLPFFVFWLFGTLEPTESKAGGWLGVEIGYSYYPVVYSIKIAATILSMLVVLKGYLAFPLRFSPLGFMVGVVGACFWIGICSFELEEMLLAPIGLGSLIGLGERSAYNPLEILADTPGWAHTFLVIRFIGLALVVPVMEEFFLRGFLMRFVMSHEWWKIPFGKTDLTAVIVGTVIPMLMHPGELFAAAVWFSLVTWLMLRTRNIWDCVTAHVVTNLLLGIYVVTYGRWELM